jgi:hypothetical protein
MLTDDKLGKMDDRRPYMTCHDQKEAIDEIKRLRSVLSSIAEIVPETAPEAWMVQEAKDALGVKNDER